MNKINRYLYNNKLLLGPFPESFGNLINLKEL